MGVKKTDNTESIENKFVKNASIFLRFMGDEVIKESEPNTPKKRGNLRRDVIKQVTGLKSKVVWGKRYAIYQETRQFKNYSTPGTGPHFAENAVKKTPDKTREVAQKSGLI